MILACFRTRIHLSDIAFVGTASQTAKVLPSPLGQVALSRAGLSRDRVHLTGSANHVALVRPRLAHVPDTALVEERRGAKTLAEGASLGDQLVTQTLGNE